MEILIIPTLPVGWDTIVRHPCERIAPVLLPPPLQPTYRRLPVQYRYCTLYDSPLVLIILFSHHANSENELCRTGAQQRLGSGRRVRLRRGAGASHLRPPNDLPRRCNAPSPPPNRLWIGHFPLHSMLHHTHSFPHPRPPAVNPPASPYFLLLRDDQARGWWPR